MSGADIERSYRQCMKREVDRERQWRKSKRHGDVRNATHICDFEAAEAAEESPSWLSDKGAGVERITAACDGETPETCYQRALRNARKRLMRRHPELAEVFNLIVKNGSNRKESIWALTRKRHSQWTAARVLYWDHLKKISFFFRAQ